MVLEYQQQIPSFCHVCWTEFRQPRPCLHQHHVIKIAQKSKNLINIVTTQHKSSEILYTTTEYSKVICGSDLSVTYGATPLPWIHILVFHLLTTLHKSDPHCHHHLCDHQSLLFFSLDLKHISSQVSTTVDFTIDTH